MAITEKVAIHEAEINKIRTPAEDNSEVQTRAIGFTIDSGEEEFYDDED